MIRVLALTKYGHNAASTRQRFLQYGPRLEAAGFTLSHAPLFDDSYLEKINRGLRQNFWRITLAYAERLAFLIRHSDADIIWVQYELFPFMPALIERLAFMRGKPVIVDYDDAFFHNYDLHESKLVRKLLGRKMAPLIRGAVSIVAGNQYLAKYVGRWNENVVIIPTVVDTDAYVPQREGVVDRPVTIGWIGSPTTWTVYVRPYLELLQEICKVTGARLLVVGAGDSAQRDHFDGMILRSWVESREVSDIHEMDLGIMPLPDDPWARGKCGYKLIQYMACGLPVVASPVGVNTDIVDDGVNGFLARDLDEWRAALTRLINDANLRRTMGSAGRRRAVAAYSLEAQAPRLIAVLSGSVAPLKVK